ncbi:hypothetical protein GOBAR_DD25112 [Gossypium barbadense]|nr:hypothetical protein GOBAR_DD25112 [Gossypium barbadense]
MEEPRPVSPMVQRKKEISSALMSGNPNMQVYIEYLTRCLVSLGSVVTYYADMHGLKMSPWPQPPLSWNAPTNVDPMIPPQ